MISVYRYDKTLHAGGWSRSETLQGQGVRDLTASLARHQEPCERGPYYLFHLILDGTVDQYAVVLDHLADTLDDVEVQVLRQPSQELLLGLLQLKREIIHLRKTLI